MPRIVSTILVCLATSTALANPTAPGGADERARPTAGHRALFEAMASDMAHFFGETDSVQKLRAATPQQLDITTADWDELASAYDGVIGKYTLTPTAATTDAELASMMKRLEIVTISDDELKASRASLKQVVPFAIKKLGKTHDFPGAELATYLLAHTDQLPAAMKKPLQSTMLFGSLVGQPSGGRWAVISMSWKDKDGKHNHAGLNFALPALSAGTWNYDGRVSQLLVVRKAK
jgi:hypothetical protein